ncbi:MAG: type II toxin-antitoxin system VapC family toxin [Vicinamibacterales bacterium]
MIVVDANLLIYAIDADAPRHAAARRWLERIMSGPERVGLPWAVLLAFIRLTTRSTVFVRPIEPRVALDYVEAWLTLPNVEPVVPGPRHWTLLRELIDEAGTAANLTSDAHIAALAIEHGATLHSADNDFKRFARLVHVNPLAT